MEEAPVVVCFGGRWESSSDGNEKYIGFENAGIVVSKDMKYEGLLNTVCGVIGVDKVKYKVFMRISVDAMGMKLKPFEIKNDNDVEFFMSINKRSITPLCVTADVITEVPVENRQACMSASSNNQVNNVAPSVPAVVFPTSSASDDGNENIDDRIEADGLNDIPEDRQSYVSNNCLNEQHDACNLHARKSKTQAENPFRFNPHFNPFQFLPPLPPSDLGTKKKGPPSGIGDVRVGNLYRSKDEIYQALSLIALNGNWSFKVSRSTKDRFETKCDDEKCKWRLRAVSVCERKFFMVKRVDANHSCSRDQPRDVHRQAKSRIIGKIIKNKFTSSGRICKPKEIQAEIREKFGVELTYATAWRAKEHACKLIVDTPEDAS